RPATKQNGKAVPGTGGWDAVWNGVANDADKTQTGKLEQAVIQSELEDVFHTKDELKAMGLNDNTVAAYRQLHRLFRVALEQVINPLRKRLGMYPISGIKGFYFPHKWLGVYEILTRDGERIESPSGQASFATMYDARKVARAYMQDNPSAHISIEMRRQ